MYNNAVGDVESHFYAVKEIVTKMWQELAIKLFTQPPNEGAIINILVLNLLIINVTEHYLK